MSRYYEVRECEHGNEGYCDELADHQKVEGGYHGMHCPGGSRRELGNVEIVGWMKDSWGLPVVGYFKNRESFKDEDQRFLVIPLSGDTDG